MNLVQMLVVGKLIENINRLEFSNMFVSSKWQNILPHENFRIILSAIPSQLLQNDNFEKISASKLKCFSNGFVSFSRYHTFGNSTLLITTPSRHFSMTQRRFCWQKSYSLFFTMLVKPKRRGVEFARQTRIFKNIANFDEFC